LAEDPHVDPRIRNDHAAGERHGPPRQFHEGKLGLRPIGQKPGGKFVYDCSGAMLALFPKAGGIRADHTAVSFKLPDIASSIAELQGAGVTFEDYDFPGLKTIGHVCVLGAEKAAWFMDTEANILCQHEDLE